MRSPRVTPVRKRISDSANEILDQLLACRSAYQYGDDLAGMMRGALAVVFAEL
jgi:hypothetical protein